MRLCVLRDDEMMLDCNARGPLPVLRARDDTAFQHFLQQHQHQECHNLLLVIADTSSSLCLGMGKSERPEHVAPPEVFYDEQEAHKYTCNSRIIAVQASPPPSNHSPPSLSGVCHTLANWALMPL